MMKWLPRYALSLGLTMVSPLYGQELPGEDVFAEDDILSILRQVNDYQVNHPWTETDRNWIRATYYTGVMGAYRATGDPAYLEQAKAWGKKHQWQVGTENSGYNQLFCAMTWVELHLLDSAWAKLEPTIDWLNTDAPTSPGGATNWYGHAGPHENLLYADSLFGAPAFAMLHQATGDPRYLEIMHDSFWKVTDAILDQDHDLYYRDRRYIGRTSPHGKPLLWSRGNGWAFAGIARVLAHLPDDDPFYERYLDLYRRMAKSLAARQHEDGFWRSNLSDPDHYLMPESSGTAFFTFGFAWGIAQGLLDRDAYVPTVIRAWTALRSGIHPNGKLGWVQPVDAEPRPSLPVTTHEYATGLFLLAGSEVLQLVQSNVITPELTVRHSVGSDVILPPVALRTRPLGPGDHPLADTIQRFIERQPQVKAIAPTGLGRQDYLEVIAGQVRAMQAYQDDEGRIIDPVAKAEMYYTTPCYAHSVAVLAHAGYDIRSELVESGMRALDVSTESLARNTVAGGHGDFYTWPVMFAYELFSPLASDERRARWSRRLSAMDIRQVYKMYRSPYPAYEHSKFYREYGPAWGNNWNLLNAAAESLRAQHGFTHLAYTDFCLAMQLPHFTRYGMYDEPGSPLAYDLFSRHYLTGMLHRGYRSFSYTTYRNLLWRGAWTSLFMQSPTGELPTGYRSSHHIWNEAEQAVVFEVYATHYAKAGLPAEAGAFKRAAHLALQSVKRWIRPDGTGYIVKNRYPVEARHGYEGYSQHTCYNMLACSMLAQAWQFADDSVSERPGPADVGGFVIPVLTPFHKIFANAGGNYIEYDTSGDHKYNPTGLLRIHLKDGHPQLGPSDGCGPYYSGEGINLSVGPAWRTADGEWQKLADSRSTPIVKILEQGLDQVRFQVVYPDVIQTVTVDPTGVTVEDSVTLEGVDTLRVSYPMLVFDGKDRTRVELQEDSVKLTLDNRSVRFSILEPEAVRLVRSGKELHHRNGIVEEVFAESAKKRILYQITAKSVDCGEDPTRPHPENDP